MIDDRILKGISKSGIILLLYMHSTYTNDEINYTSTRAFLVTYPFIGSGKSILF